VVEDSNNSIKTHQSL